MNITLNHYIEMKLELYLKLCEEGELEYSDITVRNMRKFWEHEYRFKDIMNG